MADTSHRELESGYYECTDSSRRARLYARNRNTKVTLLFEREDIAMKTKDLEVSWRAGSREVGAKDSKRLETWGAGQDTLVVTYPETYNELVSGVTAAWARHTGEQLDAGEVCKAHEAILDIVLGACDIAFQTVRADLRVGKDVSKAFDVCAHIASKAVPRERKAARNSEDTAKLRNFLLKMQAGGLDVADMAAFAEMDVSEVEAILRG